MNESNPLVQHEAKIRNIFTLENLPAILAVVNSFRPPYGSFVRENEYATVVYAAGVSTMDELNKKIQQFVLSNNVPNVPKND